MIQASHRKRVRHEDDDSEVEIVSVVVAPTGNGAKGRGKGTKGSGKGARRGTFELRLGESWQRHQAILQVFLGKRALVQIAGDK
eukprot:1730603-Alexandrium_andersonii.AAC.1